MNGLSITVLVIAVLHSVQGCQFYPSGEYLRFVRVPENLRVGQEILRVDVHPRNNLSLKPVDKDEDVHYFTYRDLNRTTVSLLLARSLEDLVDSDNPRNVLKFRVSCDHDDGEDIITSSLSVTVYVEDVNDHAPVFVGAPYHVTVDELTPVGLTIFRGIRALDRDKPNTPNSDVQYTIISGNERGKFALDSSHQAFLILKRNLDYDSGDREFLLTISASDRGLPPRSTNTTVRISVGDNDDLSPKFTKGVYRTRINEFYPITGERIHKLLNFDPPIHAFDQDVAIDAPIRYDIIAGNERHIFSLDHVNGSLFLERELDLDSERSLPGNTFVLQIQASQIDNPTKSGVARVEVEVMDLNDNLPEFEVDFYNISIVENLPNGFSVLQIIAVDQDQGDNADFSYQLEDNSGAFTLDSRTGWLTVRDQNVLDREKRSTLSMRVYAKEKVPSVVTDKLGASSVTIEVTLLDANDNNPTFIPNNLYNYVTNSDVKIGDVIGQIHAIDPDLDKNGMVTYSIQKAPNNSIPFKIDSKTGKISVNVERVAPGRHLLFVEASDQPLNPSERRSSLAVVSIDVQQHPGKGNTKGMPDFVGAPYEFWVGGNVGIGTSVGQIRITDVPDRRTIVYDLLHSYHEGVPFAVEERSGTITVVDDLDSYNRQNYDFEAVVTNERDMSLVTNVTIHVVDPKDEKTILMRTATTPIEFHVRENLGNLLIGRLGFKNASSSSSTLHFSIANQKDVTDHISITSDGSLYTVKPLDREIRDVYRLTVLAEYSKGTVSGTGIYQVTVHVDDENDNKPTFERAKYEGKITENCISGTEVDLNYLVHVSDKDIGANGQFTVTIFGNGSEQFRLDRNTGKIFFISANSPLDREETPLFNLRLVAKDKGGLYDEAILVILVEDENDNVPNFIKFTVEDSTAEVVEFDHLGNRIGHFQLDNSSTNTYNLISAYNRSKKKKISPLIKLKEDVNIGTTIIKLIAEDRDFGDNALVKYEMVSETYIPNEYSSEPFHLTQYFMVHGTSGEVSVSRTLPPESEFRLNISASDRSNLKDYISVRFLIEDVNDHPPVFSKAWYSFDLEEGTYSGTIIGRVTATDPDFGTNSNVTYSIDDLNGPFSVLKTDGTITVNGILDRETRDKYTFTIVAQDNPAKDQSLKSSVDVEVSIIDINDNPPKFYGFDDFKDDVPIFYATVSENSPIGTPVTRIFANDSDYSGNGNGLFLFSIPHKKNEENLFTIDSKEGIVTTIMKLDYETQSSHNVTIVASDLGSPSLSSSALLMITVLDLPEDFHSMDQPVFAHRYYEVEVEENVPVPLKVLQLNVTEPYRAHKLRYSIVAEKSSNVKKVFRIDPRNGSLFIIESPDREKKALYELVIRLDQYKVGRDMTVMVYPVTNERLGNLGLNEVKVIVKVTDVNDNVPRFVTIGRPLIAAIPTTANYGYHIVRLQWAVHLDNEWSTGKLIYLMQSTTHYQSEQHIDMRFFTAKDPDLGLNGEVRYQILGRADEATKRFTVDPITGQVRAIANFARDAGKVYGFDVKATDRKGADDGKSSIANVFVYVLDDQKQLVMVMGMKPTEVERSMDNITMILYNTTGFDVRIRKLEPHSERNQVDNSATDMYLYAVDPLLNVVVDMEHLQKILQLKHSEIEQRLEGPKVLAVASGMSERGHTRNQRVLLSSLEVGVVILGCVIFIGALATAICVMCARRRKRRLLQKSFGQPLGYTIGTLGKPALFPAALDTLRYDTNRDMVHHHHDRTCPRVASSRRQTFRERSRSSGCIEKSITSLHSSGQDSGIVDAALHCQCHSSTQSSEESSNYEDSLQSVPQRKSRSTSIRQVELSSTRNSQQRRSRNRSISEDIVQGGALHRMRSLGHIPAPPPMMVSGPSTLRRSSDRLIIG